MFGFVTGGVVLVKVQHILEVVQINVVSGKLKVLLVEEDLQLHECSIFLPYPLVNVLLNPINKLLPLLQNGFLLLILDRVHSLIEQ